MALFVEGKNGSLQLLLKAHLLHKPEDFLFIEINLLWLRKCKILGCGCPRHLCQMLEFTTRNRFEKKNLTGTPDVSVEL